MNETSPPDEKGQSFTDVTSFIKDIKLISFALLGKYIS